MAHVFEQTTKFGPVKNFKRTEKVSFDKKYYKLYIDKNDSVWDVKECQAISWKTIKKGHKKINVPDQIAEIRDVELFNRVKGNPFKIAANKIVAKLEYTVEPRNNEQ